MLCILNLYSAECQLYLFKIGGRKVQSLNK